MSLESRRLIWSAQRTLNLMDNAPEDALEDWIVMREKRLNRLVDDLLELSSYVLMSDLHCID